MKRLTLLALLAGALGLSPALLAAESDAPGFPPTSGYAQIDTSLDDARQDALRDDKLLMVVMGADWCHDSRAFIAYLDDPAFSALIDQRFVVVRVNIGFYEHIRGVVDRWDVPVIYGTPTVLVVEPGSDTVLNRDSLSYWRNADALGVQETVPYFDAFRPGTPAPAETLSAGLTDALAEIDAFERGQAERLYVAFEDLGQRLQALGDERPDEAFMKRWDNVAAMRSSITEDLARLRQSARAQDAAGADPIRLTFPDYDLYTD